jgi:cytoskeletal protein RodZ
MERENRGLSLKVVSQHTKISATMLQNLEEENFDMLPNTAYVKGFIKSVSKTLGISESVALEIYQDTLRKRQGLPKIEEKAEPAQKLQATDAHPSSKNKSEATSEEDAEPVFKMGIVILAALVITAFVVLVNTSNDKESKEVPKITEVKPDVKEVKPVMPQTLTADTPLRNENPIANVTPNNEVTVETTEQSTVEPTPIATAPPTPQPTETTEEKKEEKKEEEKKEEEKIIFRKFTRDLYAFETEAPKEAFNEHVPDSYQTSVIQGKQNIFIKAVSGDTWLTYKADNNPIKKFILKKGRHLIIRGDEVIAFLGNVKVTKIFLNNKLIKVETRSGVKSLVFPQKNKDSYRFPLFIYNDKKGSVMTSKQYLEENPE